MSDSKVNTDNRVVWFDIPVADLDRAANFYRSVLNITVDKEKFGETSFCILEHNEGIGGCLVLRDNEISAEQGILVYMNVNGRIKDAVGQVEKHGGKISEPIHGIGPYGFRALVVDSEGNRIALHSET